ncbi:LuxE/PaaK family acyltransferase [Niabella ginsengisoli]|uniref:Acyl transferase n=1 Tax=Niabella ginsengisoli TaxID=522298 RepID=A0ABS9SEM9_9BACT|nr:acyl transferase [Niabella ginsengisoli]MCH5596813.1 acyl transferase [Niabella ginsengisoli]
MDNGANLIKSIFNDALDFNDACLQVFRFQYANNNIYKQYVDALAVPVSKIDQPAKIPFLPIRFFKTHRIISTTFTTNLVFESSGTTETINSKHYVKDAAIYEQSFNKCFEQFYGKPDEWCVLGLLPSYLERQNSSLVYMVQKLIDQSGHDQSGFYLNDFDKLIKTLQTLEAVGQKTLLIGVTFGLLDFAEKYKMPLKHTIVMETGGMKGRRREMIRAEVHDILKQAFSLNTIHSEYGMTELLSQAYSHGNGLFKTPDWMRILLRDEEDPLTVKEDTTTARTRGLINIIDLANIYSCSFIATDDLGVLNNDGSFEVTGRMDNSDLRGCSLLVV